MPKAAPTPCSATKMKRSIAFRRSYEYLQANSHFIKNRSRTTGKGTLREIIQERVQHADRILNQIVERARLYVPASDPSRRQQYPHLYGSGSIHQASRKSLKQLTQALFPAMFSQLDNDDHKRRQSKYRRTPQYKRITIMLRKSTVLFIVFYI